VASESLDAVVSVFAPVAEEEFSRVLKPGGILVLAGAGPEHLLSMKKVLYDTPYLNEPRADVPERMTLLEHRRIRYVAQLDSEMLGNLFAMTPYAYRTSREGKARLDATDSLGVDVDVELAIYRR
jgi:23S rRNA (guanine745-N1)-methyltransferase